MAPLSTGAVTFLAAAVAATAIVPPRLLVSIIVDDLGHADLGFTGSLIRTPHLDRLRAEGIALTSFYVQPICTPSRAAFLTGRYPLLLGLQGKQTVQQGCAWGLDVAEQTFASALQKAGFATHMVGKAHLGADVWRRTPTFRGFDSFVGYLYGAEDYFTHKLANGFDLRNDTGRDCGPGCSRDVAAAHNGTYSSELFGAEVSRLVAAATGPTYIHFTPQSVHAPNEAPAADIAPYVPVFKNNPVRAIHAGALAALDTSIGTVLAAIDAAGLQNETLIVLHADNGGPLGPTGDGTQASNFPLRGGKHSVFEGGVRAMAYAWGTAWLGAGVNRSWAGLVHVTDVGLTLLDAAGVAPLAPLPGRPVSGRSFWAPLVAGRAASDRAEVIINVDYTAPAQAAIVLPRNGSHEWKLILGAVGQAVGPPQLETTWSAWDGMPESPQPGPPAPPAPPAPPVPPAPGWPLYDMRPTLFDLAVDPRETRNVSALFPDVVAELTARIAAWALLAVPVVENATADPRADPAHFNGSWTPWLGLGTHHDA
jgi:arylsulfatase B